MTKACTRHNSGDGRVTANLNDGPDYRGNNPKTTSELRAWYASRSSEQAIEPSIPIVDAHHHLFGQPEDERYYCREDLLADFHCGHDVVGTVYCEAYFSGWYEHGPQAMRSTGEVAKIAELATDNRRYATESSIELAAGVVSHIDMRLGDGVVPVIDAHLTASKGRLRGVRHMAATDDGTVGREITHRPEPGLMARRDFRDGVAQLGRHGLSFDACVYHTQLDEVVSLADAVPDTTIILNHVGMPIGVAEYRSRQRDVRADWVQGLSELMKRPNVRVKLGGLGMPVFGFGFESAAYPARGRELAPTWQPYLDTCIDLFGADRCMFESNFPVDKQSCSYVSLWNAFKLCTQQRSSEDRRNLFYASACRAYRLPDLERIADGRWLHTALPSERKSLPD